ncbi:TPA: hypothetical protein N0F65_002014 [Lagenidium giganteum]|uniref:tryptophan synthase n=1 Tax=Lagenidium giganteum TaxID=4803 RepID=A0AAV2YYB1_9STRA|nr:TPA: hypothetical protein N0F65_002014 [Lagenidium giganteum]
MGLKLEEAEGYGVDGAFIDGQAKASGLISVGDVEVLNLTLSVIMQVIRKTPYPRTLHFVRREQLAIVQALGSRYSDEAVANAMDCATRKLIEDNPFSIIKKGLMYLQDPLKNDWKPRYVVLEADHLVHYADPNCIEDAEGRVCLLNHHCVVRDVPGTSDMLWNPAYLMARHMTELSVGDDRLLKDHASPVAHVALTPVSSDGNVFRDISIGKKTFRTSSVKNQRSLVWSERDAMTLEAQRDSMGIQVQVLSVVTEIAQITLPLHSLPRAKKMVSNYSQATPHLSSLTLAIEYVDPANTESTTDEEYRHAYRCITERNVSADNRTSIAGVRAQREASRGARRTVIPSPDHDLTTDQAASLLQLLTLDKQLQKMGIVAPTDLPYEDIKSLLWDISHRMQQIVAADVTHPDPAVRIDLRNEYFRLERILCGHQSETSIHAAATGVAITDAHQASAMSSDHRETITEIMLQLPVAADVGVKFVLPVGNTINHGLSIESVHGDVFQSQVQAGDSLAAVGLHHVDGLAYKDVDMLISSLPRSRIDIRASRTQQMTDLLSDLESQVPTYAVVFDADPMGLNLEDTASCSIDGGTVFAVRRDAEAIGVIDIGDLVFKVNESIVLGVPSSDLTALLRSAPALKTCSAFAKKRFCYVMHRCSTSFRADHNQAHMVQKDACEELRFLDQQCSVVERPASSDSPTHFSFESEQVPHEDPSRLPYVHCVDDGDDERSAQLTVTVMAISNLVIKRKTMNALVEVCVGDETFRTPVVKHQRSPVWSRENSATFSVPNDDDDAVIHVHVYDEHRLRTSELLASVAIPLSSLPSDEQVLRSYPLQPISRPFDAALKLALVYAATPSSNQQSNDKCSTYALSRASFIDGCNEILKLQAEAQAAALDASEHAALADQAAHDLMEHSRQKAAIVVATTRTEKEQRTLQTVIEEAAQAEEEANEQAAAARRAQLTAQAIQESSRRILQTSQPLSLPSGFTKYRDLVESKSVTGETIRQQLQADGVDDDSIAKFLEIIKSYDEKIQTLQSEMERLKHLRSTIPTSASTKAATANHCDNKAEHVPLNKDHDQMLRRMLKMEHLLKQAGIAMVEDDIPYAEARAKVEEISREMAKIEKACNGHVPMDHPGYLRLEQEMEKYNTALLLSDEYIAEQQRLEREWEEQHRERNIAALQAIRRMMPVDVQAKSEEQLVAQTTPNGKHLPREIARRFKRLTVLQLLRTPPSLLVRSHPSSLSQLEVRDLVIVERRALHMHLTGVAAQWQRMTDQNSRKKLEWFNMLKQTFKSVVNAYSAHVAKYGPPENHPYAARGSADTGCPLVRQQCPVRANQLTAYDIDLGYPEGDVHLETTVYKCNPLDTSARDECRDLAQLRKLNARKHALQEHYKNFGLATEASGVCEHYDAMLDLLEQQQMKWFAARQAPEEPESMQEEMREFEDVVSQLRLGAVTFAKRAGVDTTANREVTASLSVVDARSAVECDLTIAFCVAALDCLDGIQERMVQCQTSDKRLDVVISALRNALLTLQQRSHDTLKSLPPVAGVVAPRKPKLRAEIKELSESTVTNLEKRRPVVTERAPRPEDEKPARTPHPLMMATRGTDRGHAKPNLAAELRAALKTRARLERGERQNNQTADGPTVIVIELPPKEKLGVKLLPPQGGVIDHGLSIDNIDNPLLDGKVQAGDLIVAIGGQNVDGMGFSDAIDLIRKMPRPLAISFEIDELRREEVVREKRRKSAHSDLDTQLTTYAVVFDEGPMGLNLEEATRYGIDGAVVRAVKGQAKTSGMISQGDIVYKVNETDVLCVPYSEVMQVIRNTPPPKTLQFVPKDKLADVQRVNSRHSESFRFRASNVTEKLMKSPRIVKDDGHDGDDTKSIAQLILDNQSATIKKGRMYKQGRLMRNWKSRYFVLSVSKLEYFKNPTSTSAQGELCFLDNRCTVRELPGTSDTVCKAPVVTAQFLLELRVGDRRLVMACTSESDKKGWMDALKLAMDASKTVGRTQSLDQSLREAKALRTQRSASISAEGSATFLDKSAGGRLSQFNYEGFSTPVVHVAVVSATNLTKAGSTVNAVCEISVGQESFRTSIVKGQRSPVWKQDNTASFEAPSEDMVIELRVFDEGHLFRSTELIATLTVPLKSLPNMEKATKKYPLAVGSRSSGAVLTLTLEYINKAKAFQHEQERMRLADDLGRSTVMNERDEMIKIQTEAQAAADEASQHAARAEEEARTLLEQAQKKAEAAMAAAREEQEQGKAAVEAAMAEAAKAKEEAEKQAAEARRAQEEAQKLIEANRRIQESSRGQELPSGFSQYRKMILDGSSHEDVRAKMLSDGVEEATISAFLDGINSYDEKIRALQAEVEKLKRSRSVKAREEPQVDMYANLDTDQVKLLRRLLKLEKQLQQAGIAVAADIPYEEAKAKVDEISRRMQEIGSADVTHPDPAIQKQLREEYYRLEQDMEKYNTALMLTDEYAAEEARKEREWEEENYEENLKALKAIRRMMPVDVKKKSEADLQTEKSPNGGVLPRDVARKWKRTNVLELLRMDPADIAKNHPSLLENLRVTGLSVTERRALHMHLKDIAEVWKSQQGEEMTKKKYEWFKTLKETFKTVVNSYNNHVKQYGPPDNHPYETRDCPGIGCPMIGKQCPIKANQNPAYNMDLGYPEGDVYMESNIQKGNPDDAGARALAEARELARQKVANSRADALKKHYKNVRLVAEANGVCEHIDQMLDTIENRQLQWFQARLKHRLNKTETANTIKVELAEFGELVNEVRLATLKFAERSGMNLSGKRSAANDAPDTRSSIEINLAIMFSEAAADCFDGLDERMDEVKANDKRLRAAIPSLRELLKELLDRSKSTLATLKDKGPPMTRKAKTRAEILKEAKEKNASANAPAGEAADNGAGGGDRPPHPMMGARGRGRSGRGGRGDLFAAISARGRGGGGGDDEEEGGGGRGGRGGMPGGGDLFAAIRARGRGGPGRGDLFSAIKARGGGGEDGGGRGPPGGNDLFAAIRARGRGPAGGGRGDCLSAIAALRTETRAAHAADHAQEGLLVLVVDTNPKQWFADSHGSASTQQGFQHLVESVLVFVNAYLLLHRSNRIVIIAAHAGRSEMLYPDPTSQVDTSGCAEQSSRVNARVLERLRTLSQAQLDPALANLTAISASLSRSLCFINRAINEQPDVRPRILVIQKSPDVSEHYISIMNGIFSAQKKSVSVDACILSHEHSSFMQQAAYLTGGIYYKPNDHSGLLQYLMSIYLPDPSMRKMLKLPTQDSVDFRAMCFCHKEVISTAFVCPVCLSLFCEFQPICSTCGIRSRIQPNKTALPRKRSRSSQSIEQVFVAAKADKRPAFITFTCCGFKQKEDTVDILLALQRGGANIIELGVPYSDPQADGPTIQRAHQVGVNQGITLRDVFATVKEARGRGLLVPVVLMGYYNNFLQHGEDKACVDAQEAGADGFIIVDLPPEEAHKMSEKAKAHNISYIPLISPTTSENRMQLIASVAHGFVYCVSLTGVTGERTDLPPNLDTFINKIRKHVQLPLALGFGLSTREHFVQAGAIADGVVMGSKIIKVIEASPSDTASRAANVESFCKSITHP